MHPGILACGLNRTRFHSPFGLPTYPSALASHLGLEPVTERIVIASLEAALLALPFAGFDQMLQTAGALSGRFATFGATSLALLAQLILALPRNGQIGEFVFYRSSHFSSISIF